LPEATATVNRQLRVGGAILSAQGMCHQGAADQNFEAGHPQVLAPRRLNEPSDKEGT
jgi:hypothetical protein